MNKKSKILTILVGGLLSVATISSTLILSSCKDESSSDENNKPSIPDDSIENKPSEPINPPITSPDNKPETPEEVKPVEPTITSNIIFTSESIINLKNSLISIVDNEKLTSDEFNSNLLENIKKNFNVNNKNIGNLINKVELNNQNVLEITLNKTNTKYSLSTNFDNTLAILNNNVLSITLNITSNFYTAIPVSNLSNLQSIITNYISNSQDMLTADEFSTQLNSSLFKKEIAGAIGTTQESIGDVSYSKNTLTIAPNSQTTTKVKFTSTTQSNILVDGSLRLNIASSNFYTAIPVFNLDNLQSTITNYISNSNNMFTNSEFESQLNTSAFKKVIADAISTTQDSIGNVSYSGTLLTIAPNSTTNSKVKFTLSTSSNILVNGSLQLSIATSNFYTAIQVDDSLLIDLRNEINNYLSANTMVTKNDINSYLMNEMYSFFQNVKTTSNQNLLDYVYSPTYSNNSITLKLKTNIGKYKFVQSSNNDILITSDTITLSNIQLPTNVTPQESPENWFTWDSNDTQITGLSDIGLTKKRIVLPPNATSITNDAFYNNKTLITVDMSLTSITSIPDGIRDSTALLKILQI